MTTGRVGGVEMQYSQPHTLGRQLTMRRIITIAEVLP